MAVSASPEPRRLAQELLPGTRPCASPPAPKLPIMAESGVTDVDQFHTPTTVESRLNSTPTTCPPPPVKARRVLGCKRKLSELEFFKIEAEEMERLFRPRDLLCVRRRRGDSCQEEQREASSSLSSV